jgi:hypothetical protein
MLHNTQRRQPWTRANLEFMSEELEPATHTPTESARRMTPAEQAVASAREKLSRYVGRAVEILTELAETSENDRVRLAAADSILDRSGVGKSSTQQVEVSNGAEHEAARREAEDIMRQLERNKAHAHQGPQIRDLETLVVHEAD